MSIYIGLIGGALAGGGVVYVAMKVAEAIKKWLTKQKTKLEKWTKTPVIGLLFQPALGIVNWLLDPKKGKKKNGGGSGGGKSMPKFKMPQLKMPKLTLPKIPAISASTLKNIAKKTPMGMAINFAASKAKTIKPLQSKPSGGKINMSSITKSIQARNAAVAKAAAQKGPRPLKVK